MADQDKSLEDGRQAVVQLGAFPIGFDMSCRILRLDGTERS